MKKTRTVNTSSGNRVPKTVSELMEKIGRGNEKLSNSRKLRDELEALNDRIRAIERSDQLMTPAQELEKAEEIDNWKSELGKALKKAKLL